MLLLGFDADSTTEGLTELGVLGDVRDDGTLAQGEAFEKRRAGLARRGRPQADQDVAALLEGAELFGLDVDAEGQYLGEVELFDESFDTVLARAIVAAPGHDHSRRETLTTRLDEGLDDLGDALVETDVAKDPEGEGA